MALNLKALNIGITQEATFAMGRNCSSENVVASSEGKTETTVD